MQLITEIFRVLKPGMCATVSWEGDGSAGMNAGRGQAAEELLAFESRHATQAWVQARDAAEILYMAGSIFRYSGEWQRLRVESVTTSGRGVYALTGTKLTNRAFARQRAQLDIHRSRTSPSTSGGGIAAAGEIHTSVAWSYLPPQQQQQPALFAATSRERDSISDNRDSLHPAARPKKRPAVGTRRSEKRPAAGVPFSEKRPAVGAEKSKTLPDARTERSETLHDARAEKLSAVRAAHSSPAGARGTGGNLRKSALIVEQPPTEGRAESQKQSPEGSVDLRKQSADATSEGTTGTRGAVPNGSVGDVGGTPQQPPAVLVRSKILETMKRGINQARSRTDLAAGEKQLLEHMKMYVMETKFAEMNLSDDEREIWEEMKTEYVTGGSNTRNRDHDLGMH